MKKRNDRTRATQSTSTQCTWAPVFLAIALALTATVPAQADCPPPQNDVPLDLEFTVPVVHPAIVQLVNIYWHNDWDNVPAHAGFKKADLDRATQQLLASDYFGRLCQYGALTAPRLVYAGGKDTGQNIIGIPNNPCSLKSPGPTVSSLGIVDFLSCEESMGYRTEIPLQAAAPDPCLTCEQAYTLLPGYPLNLVGTAPPSCVSILLGNIAKNLAEGLPPDPADLGCIAKTNTSGMTIYNIVLPKGTIINDGVSQSCSASSAGAYGAYHMQIPSSITVGGGLPPVYVAGTSGRPLYYTVTLLDCATSIEDWVLPLSHEIFETLTDPLPMAHWLDRSTALQNPELLDMLKNTPGLLRYGEAADICESLMPVRLSSPIGVFPSWSLDVAPYWSNADNACVVGSRRVVKTTFQLTGLPAGLGGITMNVQDLAAMNLEVKALERKGSNYEHTGNYLEAELYTLPGEVNTSSGTFHCTTCAGLILFPAPRDPDNPTPEDQALTITCSCGLPTTGACGSANGQTFTSVPTSNLCAVGAASDVSGAGPWNWTCSGLFGGSPISCSADIAKLTVTFIAGPNGRIQTDGPLTQTVPYGGSTTAFTTQPDEGYHFVNWTDQSGSVVGTADPFVLTNVTSNRTVTANFAPDGVDGACGKANGQTFASCFTGTDLCAVGTASAVTGSGPWNWTCRGQSGGAPSYCSANVQRSCAQQPGGLVSWWPAAGRAGDTIGDRNGTLENGAMFADGRIGQGFSFNGANQYVSLPDSTIQGTSAWTVAGWFKTASGGVIVGMQNGPYGTTLNTGVSSWDPLLFVGTDGKLRGGIWPAQLTSTQSIADKNWHHAAISYENGTVNLYLDGASVGTASGVTAQSMPVNQIGTGYTVYWNAGNNGWFDFNGQIDEVTLFSRPLTAVEIRALHNAGASGICPTNADLDSSFNGSGSIVTHLPGWSEANAVTLQPDGKIVVAGTHDNALMVARYLPCGALDPEFGNGTGIFVLGLVGQSTGYGVAVYNGKIVVVGRSERDTDWQLLVMRLNASGTLDTTFAGTGYVRWNNGFESTASAVRIQDGKILIAGFTAVDFSDLDLLLMRYNWDGTPDTSFGSAHNGAVTVSKMTYDGSMGGEPVDLESLRGKALAAQSWDSKILVLGQSSFPDHLAVYRFSSTGILDTAFGVGGSTVPYHGGVPSLDGQTYGGFGSGVAVQSDHKILAAGMGISDSAGTRAVVLRYTEAGRIDTTYGTWGEGSYSEIGSGSEIAGLALQDDGKSILLGTMDDQHHPGSPDPQRDVLLVRFDTQGEVDRTFGKDGVILFNGPLNATDEGRALAIDPAGTIIAAGATQRTADTASRDQLVVRVNPTSASLLHKGIGPLDNQIPVDDLSRFPDSGMIQIDSEWISYKGKKAAVQMASTASATASQPGYLLIVARGINNTTPDNHNAAAVVHLITSLGCMGDCNSDYQVTVDEIVAAVSIAVGPTPLQQCRAADADNDGAVSIDEILGGVNKVMKGCTP